MTVKNSGFIAGGQTRPKNTNGAYSLEKEQELERIYCASQSAEVLLVDRRFTGRLMVYVESGKIMRDHPIPDDHYTASLDGLIELLQQAGYQVEVGGVSHV